MANFSADRKEATGGSGLSTGRPRESGVGRQAIPQRPVQGQRHLGRPAPQQPEAEQAQPVGRPGPSSDQQQEPDLRYVNLLAQHFNMKGLGRDVPYMVWAYRTGNYRLYAEPGRPPYDYLEDGS